MDIYLKKAALHVVDRETGNPNYSQKELDLTKEFIREYLIKKIQKLSSPQTKTGKLREDSDFCRIVRESRNNFLQSSEKLVERWYAAYQESEVAPSADAFVVLYEQDTKLHLAFLKVNYQESYTHSVGASSDGLNNELVVQRSMLSGKTQKADEGVTVNLEDLSFELIEKKYEFSGEKRFYFSEEVIESDPTPSLEENVKVIKKVAEQIGVKFDNEKHDIISNVKEAVFESVEENGKIDTDKVAKKVFKNNLSAQLAFKEEVVEKGFIDQGALSQEAREIAEKKYSKQKLTLSNGIELTVPVEIYRNSDLIEFINNPDGTISVAIKNVDEVVSKM